MAAIRVGSFVSLKMNGRIAKKKNGKITNKWIEIKDGDVGRVVGMGGGRVNPSFAVLLMNGETILVRKNHVILMDNHEIRPTRRMVEADKDRKSRLLEYDLVAENTEY